MTAFFPACYRKLCQSTLKKRNRINWTIESLPLIRPWRACRRLSGREPASPGGQTSKLWNRSARKLMERKVRSCWPGKAFLKMQCWNCSCTYNSSFISTGIDVIDVIFLPVSRPVCASPRLSSFLEPLSFAGDLSLRGLICCLCPCTCRPLCRVPVLIPHRCLSAWSVCS